MYGAEIKMEKFTKKVASILMSLSIILTSSCAQRVTVVDENASTEKFIFNDDETVVRTTKDVLGKMSLREKVGQLFIVRPEALAENSNAETAPATDRVDDAVISRIEEYPVGGIALFSRNITSAEQLPMFISDLQSSSKYPLFIAVDEEGGRVARIANSDFFNVASYKSMEDIGKSGDASKAEEVGRQIGSYLKELGFNLDFAPVADTNTNPQNIVIGDRSYGSDPALVARMVSAQLDGMHDSGIMGTLKHFPGHGDTKDDTHSGYVSIEKTWDELKECELVPFITALPKADMVMVSHITAVNVTSDKLPTSMSETMITGKLRNELGYDGVIITDAMAMGAVADNYTSAEAAVTAVKAGVDIVLMPQNLDEAFNGVMNAVTDGEISMERLDESVLRILKMKAKYKLI
ncbi:glycosyl hydrolase family 3 N-terminal domain protein [[Eubacterium] siraeum DSM 15702]|uniref:beta-N-acetylhexosaminidase n=1 Tax=[Eubacterium] siraeum DSM 15702 TaxID=428128 RepID=B0MSB5_9FIRM|nr:glycosyl hydrolase family 3 N-terminal domain protein [[Eubacterium] siraeum DSM 15702]MBE5721287.1 glycoside hydrolase family 3 protein [Ruminiclostridium sp.]